MSVIQPILLTGNVIQLEMLNETHKNELYEAAQDEKIWTFTQSKAFHNHFYPWFDKAIISFQEGKQLPFIVRQQSDKKIIGSTRYYDINFNHRRLTIGYTWYIQSAWGTAVNPECKYLLLQHAFEILAMNRVEFVIDSRNLRSRAAIKKLGATEEGILRQHMILENGIIRDSIIFSIIKSEWPIIQASLKSRLEKNQLTTLA